MPFYTYAIESSNNERRYSSRENVKLAGSGLIRQAWRRFQGSKTGPWWVSAKQMLESGGIDRYRAIVIDTAPKRDTVSLFEIKYVLGVNDGWMPLCIVMEQLFVDEDVGDDPQSFKLEFGDGRCSRETVRTILYLKNDGNWGGNSRTTAALLWGETWNHFRDWKPPTIATPEA